MDWKGLLKNLEEQGERHRELLELLRREEHLQPGHPAEELEAINRLRSISVEALGKLEENRRQILSKGSSKGFSTETGIRKLAEHCGEKETREKLMAWREELTGLIDEIQSQARKNEIILRGRRMALNSLQESLRTKLSSTRLYSGSGKAVNTPITNIMQRWI